jgi:uncharacterized protein YjbJ (UPF0337 family)
MTWSAPASNTVTTLIDHGRTRTMSLGDKINNKADELGGKAKETAGDATGDQELADEGRSDQAGAAVKGAAENVKRTMSDAAEKIRRIAGHK